MLLSGNAGRQLLVKRPFLDVFCHLENQLYIDISNEKGTLDILYNLFDNVLVNDI